jgi:hypothetical protein
VEHAARIARARGIPVTVDVDTIYPGFDRVLPLVDYLIASSEFPGRWTRIDDPFEALAAIQRTGRDARRQGTPQHPTQPSGAAGSCAVAGEAAGPPGEPVRRQNCPPRKPLQSPPPTRRRIFRVETVTTCSNHCAINIRLVVSIRQESELPFACLEGSSKFPTMECKQQI